MNTTEEEEHGVNPDVSSFSLSDCTSQEALKKYRVADLKLLLQARGLSKEGRKDDLVKRLWEWAQAEEALKLADEDFEESQVKKIEGVEKQPAESITAIKKAAPVIEVPKQEPKKVVTPVSTVKESAVPLPSAKAVVSKEEDKRDSSQDKLQARKDRFGPVETEGAKAKARAERFGTVDEETKRQRREERFGHDSSMSKSGKEVDEEMMKKMRERQARFGETTSKILARTEEQEAKRRRMERFGGN
jgi:SAP domain-containing protein